MHPMCTHALALENHHLVENMRDRDVEDNEEEEVPVLHGHGVR